MVEAFASYASVAIGNARLYATSQEQAWVATVLLQVASALQTVTSPEEMSATIVRLAPLLVGVKGCAMLLWDPIQEVFSLQAAHGFNHAPLADFETTSDHAPGDQHLRATLQQQSTGHDLEPG